MELPARKVGKMISAEWKQDSYTASMISMAMFQKEASWANEKKAVPLLDKLVKKVSAESQGQAIRMISASDPTSIIDYLDTELFKGIVASVQQDINEHSAQRADETSAQTSSLAGIGGGSGETGFTRTELVSSIAILMAAAVFAPLIWNFVQIYSLPIAMIAGAAGLAFVFTLNKNFREGVVSKLAELFRSGTFLGNVVRVPLLGTLAMSGGVAGDVVGSEGIPTSGAGKSAGRIGKDKGSKGAVGLSGNGGARAQQTRKYQIETDNGMERFDHDYKQEVADWIHRAWTDISGNKHRMHIREMGEGYIAWVRKEKDQYEKDFGTGLPKDPILFLKYFVQGMKAKRIQLQQEDLDLIESKISSIKIRMMLERLGAEVSPNGSMVWMKKWTKLFSHRSSRDSRIGRLVTAYIRVEYNAKNSSLSVMSDRVSGKYRDYGLTVDMPIRLDGGTGLYFFWDGKEFEMQTWEKGDSKSKERIITYKVQTTNPLEIITLDESQTTPVFTMGLSKENIDAFKSQGFSRFSMKTIPKPGFPSIAIELKDAETVKAEEKQNVPAMKILASFFIVGLLAAIIFGFGLGDAGYAIGPGDQLLGKGIGGSLIAASPLLHVLLGNLRNLYQRVFGEVFPHEQEKVVEEMLDILNKNDAGFEWEQTTNISSLLPYDYIGKAFVPVREIQGQETFEQLSRDGNIKIERDRGNRTVSAYRKAENGNWELLQVIGSAISAYNQPYYRVRDSNVAVGLDQNLVKIYEISYFLPHTENNIYVLETKQVLKIGELPLKSAQVLKLKGSNSTSAESSGTQSLAALGVENQELYMDLLTVYVGGLSTSQIAQKSGVREDVIKGFLTRAFVPTRSERRKIEIFNTAALRRLHLQTVTFDDRALMKVFKTLYFDLGYDRARSGALAIELSLSQEDLQKILQGVYQGKRLTLARAVAFLKSRKVMAFKTRSRFIAEAQLTVPILHTVFDIRRAFTQKLSAALRRHGHLEKEMENPQLKFSFLPPHKEFYTSPDKQRIRIHEMREGDWKVSALNPELPFPKEVGISSVQDSTQVLNNLNLALEGWIFNIETISDLSDIARAIELEVEEIESGRIENARLQTLAITPRSLMTQVEVDDTPVPSGLLDVVAFFFNNLENLKKLGLTPQLALHVETVEEALFWNQALALLEQSLRLEKGAIKVFILVKNYRTLFELEEILWALQSRAQAITLGEGMFNSIAATRIKTIAEKRKIHFISDLYLKRTAESELEVDYYQDAENRLNEMRKGTILDKDDLSKAISEAFETLYVHLGGDVRGNSFTIQELDQLEMQQLNIWNAVHGGEEVKVKYYLNLFSDSLIKKYKELEARLELTTGKDFPEIRKHLTLAFAILQQAMVNSKVFVPLSQLVEVVASDLTNPDQALERMVQFSEFSSQPNIRGFYAAAKLSLWNQLFKEVFSQGVRPQHNEPQVKVNIESSEPLKNPSRPIILSQIGGILAWPLLPIDIKLEVVTFVKNFVLWAAAHPMAIVSGVLLMRS